MKELERGLTITPEKSLKKIALVGRGHIGVGTLASSIVKILGEDKKMIVLGDYQEPTYDLEINGIKYKRIKQKTKNYTSYRMLAMANMYMPILENHYSSRDKLPMPKVNIVEEFKLIQNKLSKLTKREREWVVAQFHKSFYIV
jgi:hypothetical protein